MKNVILIVLLIITLHSCDKQISEPFILFSQDRGYVRIITENITDTITIKIETDFINSIPNVINVKHNVELTNDSICLIELKMLIPDIVNFEINNQDLFTTYLIPGDTLNIYLNQEPIEFGRHKTLYKIEDEIFSYCQSKYQKFGYYRIHDGPARKRWLTTPCTSEDQYISLVHEADSVANENISFLEENKMNLPLWFVNLEKNNIIYIIEYCKMLFHWSLFYSRNVPEENLIVKTPIYNEDALFSSDYYSFLIHYIHRSFNIDNPLDPTSAVLKRLSYEYSTINTLLQGRIRNIVITSIITKIYQHCRSIDDIIKVDTFLISNNYNLTSEELMYIDKIKMYFADRLIDLSSLSLNTGDNAPDFELRGADDKVYKLSQFKSKFIYIHFWATWCAPCLVEMPVLNQLITDLNTFKLVVLNVCLDNEPDKWRQIIKEKGLQGLNLICSEEISNELKSQYKISSLPHYCLVNKNGIIIKNQCERPGVINGYLNTLLKEN